MPPGKPSRYSPSEQVGLRVSYSSGYRAPQAYNEDLHIEAVGGALALIRLAKGLKPEYSHSVSASADLYHSFGRLQANLLVEGFYTMLNNVFTLVPGSVKTKTAASSTGSAATDRAQPWPASTSKEKSAFRTDSNFS